MAWTRPRRLASQQPSMLIDLSPGRHVRWRPPPSVNTSDDQSFPQLSGVRLSPFVFISADDAIPCRIWVDETRPRLLEEHRCNPASGLLRAFDEMARFRCSNLQYLIMSHARHGPRGISPWTVWKTPKRNYTISSANTIPRRVWLKE